MAEYGITAELVQAIMAGDIASVIVGSERYCITEAINYEGAWSLAFYRWVYGANGNIDSLYGANIYVGGGGEITVQISEV